MVLQILSVVVPLLAAAIPLFRWPTLERRTRAHVALMKELPDDMGKRFRDAVEEELRELGHRAEQRLTRNVRILEFTVRAAIVFGLLTISSVAYRRVIESDEVLLTLREGLTVVTGAIVLITLLSLLWRAAGSRYELERLGRRAQDEGKTLTIVNGRWRVVSDEEYAEIKRRLHPDPENDEASRHAREGKLEGTDHLPDEPASTRS